MGNGEIEKLLALQAGREGYTRRNLFETLALLDGYKPVMRLVVAESGVRTVSDTLRSLGLAVELPEWRLRIAYTTSLEDAYTEIAPAGCRGAGWSVIAVAQTATSAREFLDAELQGDPERVARLLGYPRCCAAAYRNHSSQRDWLCEVLENTPLAPDYPHETNRLAYLFDEDWMGFDYFPCSLRCASTTALSRTVSRIVRERGLANLADAVEAALRVPILLYRGVIVQLRGARVEGEHAVYDLSRARLQGWKVEQGADEDPVWTSDSVTRGSTLTFTRQGEVVASRSETCYERLLLFE